MLNITEENIKSNCYSMEVYRKGLSYYKLGRVKDIDINQNYAKGIVSGTDNYHVSLNLSKGGKVGFAECDCPAYDSYPGYCKHIVAMLLYLKDQKQSVIDMRINKISGQIVNFFENRSSFTQKLSVEIEFTLELLVEGTFHRQVKPALSMRIGQNKLYIVKNIKDFIGNLETYKCMEFGKNFFFDPSLYTFSEKDLSVINLIKEIYEIDREISGNLSYNQGKESMFKGKYIYLAPTTVDRFFNLMGDRSFRVAALNVLYEDVRVVSEDLPLEFLVKKFDGDLMLDIKMPPHLIPVSGDGKYMFFQGRIYKVSKYQRENFAPFYNALLETGESSIRFPEKDNEKFVSVVLPRIKNIGKLIIDESIETLFYQKPLEAKIYLDKFDEKITAIIDFVYGEYSINPFDSTIKIQNEDIILVRDPEKERNVLSFIEQAEFKINKSLIYIEEDDSIFDFVSVYLPKLQELCEIYYSDAFKNIKLYDTSYYKTSVRLKDKSDLLEFNFSIEGVERSNLPEIFASIKQKKKYYRLSDGSFLPLENDEIKNIADLMEYLDLEDSDFNRDIISLPKSKALYIDEQLKGSASLHVERNTAFKELVNNIREPKDMDYPVPESLKGILRGYQITGFKWLKTLADNGFGGILADEMGLGKTLQTISFLVLEKEKINLPSIVICPTSLIYNWESEIQKFAPELRTLVLSGNKIERESQMESISDVDVAITSYPLIRRDIESYKDLNFAYCILDEAQHIKNPGSLNARSVKEIKAKGYFALTGTPIENNLTELWSIFDFLMPGYLLSHKKFCEKFEKPVINNQDKNALKELKMHVKPFIMRRIKKDVLSELPPKIESIVKAELTDEQKKIYLAYLHQIKDKIEEEIRDKGFEKSHIQILAGLTRLRQICCHPSMFIEGYDGGSGKMDLLMELIQELLEGGHRILLFSQFTSALKLIRENLINEKITYFYLDGSIKAENRGEMVKSFNQGSGEIFLISLKAGGTGLNLIGADTVIHFDPWWNPAVEEQATDRAHRIGQKSTVQVMKLITRGTIEEKIYKLQERKRELIGTVLQPGETFISKMNEEDIKELFKI